MTKRCKHAWIMRWIIIGAAIGIIGASAASAADESDGTGWVSKIVSLQGSVLVMRHGQARWRPVKLNDTFFPGDQIRVEINSRAGIVLSNDALMRLDQNSSLIFTEIEQKRTFIFKLMEGAANFFSHRPRSLKILTPFVNGVVEGTEFFVRVDAVQTRIDLFEGRILARNDQGTLDLTKGQGTVARAATAPQRYLLVRPRESVQWAMYYPPVLAVGPNVAFSEIEQALGLFNAGQTAAALTRLAAVGPESRDAAFHVCRAAIHMHIGRITEAQTDIEHVLSMDPHHGDALALKAVIAVVQNRSAEAVDMARQAVRHNPQSASARIALSYAMQATFDLPEALDAARGAVVQAPHSGLAWARLADLQLSAGALDKGVDAAKKAVALAPRTAHAHTILGFAHLTRVETDKAREAFTHAIDLDSAAPLPRLGLGLATIRNGDLETGRSEIEIAAGLDPGNSLIRSYLGKAYFEEKRDPRDGQQFGIAKSLDPNDPTPWFYDAIRKQSLNRPVEALHDLQKSIALNDNRAVYRSRLLLDEDLAARNASLGSLYRNLGFDELSLRQGWRSLNADPSEYSAHQLLAESYSFRPRHEIARVSEILQAQLLRPLNTSPIRPLLSESDLLISINAGSGETSLNEYNPLFTRDRVSVKANGIAGSNDTLGSEISILGLYDKYSLSAGRYDYKTDGFRENNDVDQNISNAIFQTALTPLLNIQAEYRRKNVEHGDLPYRWELDESFFPDYRVDEKTDTWRAGLTIDTSLSSTLLASIIYQDMTQDQSVPNFTITYEGEGFIGEIQYMLRQPFYDLIIGGGHYVFDAKITYDVYGEDETDVKHTNGYVYSNIRYPGSVVWTVGASYDALEDDAIGDFSHINPKFGVTWSASPMTLLRFGAFKCLKRSLVADQTIEPTQIAGFNQFYDDFNGTDYNVYGAGVDHSFMKSLDGGIEYYIRDLDKTMLIPGDRNIEEEWREKTLRAYLYWTLPLNVFISAEYNFELFDREFDSVAQNPSEQAPFEMKTHTAPVAIGFSTAKGFFGSIKATYVNQKVLLVDQPEEYKNDDFVLFDLSAGYRFPYRFGILNMEIKNLFDKEMQYLGMDTRNSHISTTPPFIPERTFTVSLSLSF